MGLGERFRYVRDNIANKTRNEFAEEFNLTYFGIESIETGKTKSISPELAESMCKKYNVSFEWLLLGHEIANEQQIKLKDEQIIKIILPKYSNIKVVIEQEDSEDEKD